MFNIGFAELLAIIVVCLVVFGPERLPEVARQLGRFIGQARLTTQRMLDELRSESELKDLNLPELKVGNLRHQARSYVTGLLDVEGQMAELEREAKGKEQQAPKTITPKRPQPQTTGDGPAAAASTASSASAASPASGDGLPPVDPDAT